MLKAGLFESKLALAVGAVVYHRRKTLSIGHFHCD
jgi:hypothetical protein